MGLVAAIIFIPQLIAYRVITGQFAPSRLGYGSESTMTWLAENVWAASAKPEPSVYWRPTA